jgi:predicted O-methyltransferase YrrM
MKNLEKVLNKFKILFPDNIYFYFMKKILQIPEEPNIQIDWKSINYNRIAVLNQLISLFKPSNYLEIGCDNNYSFNSVPISKKIGVDPSKGGNFRDTSDNFFIQNQDSFDLIFIDGLHEYPQVRKDVVNSINHSNTDSWIVLHNVFPRNHLEEHTPCKTSGPWTGDVWKIGFELMSVRDIEFKIVMVDFGVLVIRKIKGDIQIAPIAEQLINADFSYFYSNRQNLPLVNWNEFVSWTEKFKK